MMKMLMRKMLMGIFCILVMSSFIACNNITKAKDNTNNVKSDTEVVNNITVTVKAPKVTIFNSDEQLFSTKSKDGSIAININTTKDNYENKIKEISIINNSVTLNTINNIIGYYDDVILDTSSLAIINYHGRKWSNFLLIDVTDGHVLYCEPFNFADIRSVYQDNDMMDYDINENDIIAFSCDKILDKDSIIISYQVRDTKGNLQSGSFKYIVSKNKFENLQENNNKTEDKKQAQSLAQGNYNQLKDKTFYKIENNKLLISYDRGKSYINTHLEISQEMSNSFSYDNIFINSNKTAVVIEDFTSANIYVSNDKCKTWLKTTLYSYENDPFISLPTYNSATLNFAEAFIGFNSDSNGWIAFGGDVAMGHENNFVFQTTDGGKTWDEVNNSSNVYAQVLTGACYTDSETGFLCFRYDMTKHGPIYSTIDGGKTWSEVQITYPSKYDNIGLTPASPRFIGEYGIIPMCSTDYTDYNNIAFYLYTNDGGKTWSYTMPS